MIALRPYQLDTIEKVRAAFVGGSRAVCVVMPTGAGKTITVGEIVRRTVERGKRVLWAAHRAELVDQACGALSSLGLSVGAISASAMTAPQPFAPVQVATIQTLLARGERPPADLIVLDEAHHYVAAEWRPILAYYPGAYVVGPTATPERSDGKGLGALFTRLVVGVRVRELVAAGHLAPATLIAPAERLKVGQIAQRPVDAYLEHARGRRAICFSPSVAVAEAHLAEFLAAGLRGGIVTGATPWAERQERFAGIRSGALNVLCNVYVATEGFDAPAVDCVILARGFGTAGTYLQCAGRGLRTSPGKADCIILDLVGTSHVHGHVEDDRQYSLDGRGIRRDVEGPRVDQPYCRVCGAPVVAGDACAECGTEPREPIRQRVVGAALLPYARKRAEPVEDRVRTLARWIALGRSKSYSQQWAPMKFKAVYGIYPPSPIMAAARAQLAAWNSGAAPVDAEAST